MTGEARRLAIRTDRGCLMERLLSQIPEELRNMSLDFQYSKSTNLYEIMKTGWDTTQACRWRVSKFYTEETDNLIQDEKDNREWMEWTEQRGREIGILRLTYC